MTGASSGIGRATALALARSGYRVVGVARRAARLEQFRALLAGEGHDLLVLPLDLAAPGAVDMAVAGPIMRWGRLDAVVAAAGHGRGYGDVTEADAAEWPGQLATNLAAPMLLAARALPHLRESGGHLVVIGSVFGSVAAPGYSAYAAAKHGLTGFLRSIQREKIARQVRVSLINPGSTNTEFSAVTLGDPDPHEIDEAVWPFRPLAADDVANAVLWVLSQPPHVTVEEVTLRATAEE